MNPRVSVIMSTFNTPNEWLFEAIDSILKQTYTDFEFLICDDCSTTDLEEVKNKINDERVIWVKNEVNLGLTKTLNKLLNMCRGEYIARMDADDISLPTRFKTQVEFLDKNKQFIVCGSYRRAFGNENQDEVWNIPKTRAEQQVQLFFFNCGLTHPTAMFRKSMLDKFGVKYNENYIKAQDYGIWVECTKYAPMAMIPKVLLKYRKSDVQISSAGKSNQKLNAQKVRRDQLNALGLDLDEKEIEIFEDFRLKKPNCLAKELEELIDKLIKANDNTGYFDKKLFKKEINLRLYSVAKIKFKIEKDKTYKNLYKRAFSLKYLVKDLKTKLKTFISKKILHR